MVNWAFFARERMTMDGYGKEFSVSAESPEHKGCRNSQGHPMPDGTQQPELEPAPAKAGVTVTLDIDADVLDWLQEQPGWRREIRDLLRSYMESYLIREAAFMESTAPEGDSNPPETLFPEG